MLEEKFLSTAYCLLLFLEQKLTIAKRKKSNKNREKKLKEGNVPVPGETEKGSLTVPVQSRAWIVYSEFRFREICFVNHSSP